MDGDVVRGLRSRGIDVVTAADAGMIRRKDEGASISPRPKVGRSIPSMSETSTRSTLNG